MDSVVKKSRRGASVANRCKSCQMRQVLCICQVIPKLNLQTRVVILMHFREARLTTNSAKLASVSLEQSEIRMRGQIGKPILPEGIISEQTQPLFLFPSTDSVELSPSFLSQFNKPFTLIVPDGSWRQAKRVGRREPILREVPHVKLPPGAPSSYRLRREPSDEHVSTFEAIARALGVIEGKAVQERLEYLFEVMVERMLWGQGILPKEKCRYPIPPAAIEAYFIDGARGSPKAKGKL
jgi:DTW domain-containing protein